VKKSILRRIVNRILGLTARFVPGSTTLRPFLHKLRGVRIRGRVFVGDDVYLENEYPELIELREGAQIGLRSILIAHTRGPGRIVIGRDVFLGAGCVVTAAPGATLTIGDGAVIAASSVVASDVPPRTLVGNQKGKPLGIVTVPLAMDTSYHDFLAGLTPLQAMSQNRASSGDSIHSFIPQAGRTAHDAMQVGNSDLSTTRRYEKPVTHGATEQLGAEYERARQLVAFALGIDTAEIPENLSADSCTSWDSLGQVAIASALFDRYGITINDRKVSHLQTLEDVKNAIEEYSRAANDGSVPQPATCSKSVEGPSSELDVQSLLADVEMLPLIDPAEATQILASRFCEEPAKSRRLKIVVASSFIAEPLATTMKVWGRAFGFELSCEFIGFDQTVRTLLDEHSAFSANEAGINVVLVDPTDRAFYSAESAATLVEELSGAIEAWRRRHPEAAPMLVGSLPPLVSAFATIDSEKYEELCHRWRTRLRTMSGVRLFDFARVIGEVGITLARNSEGEVFARMPYSSRLYQSLAIQLVRRILATRRSPAKVIALDCDNTLWGGVVGEVGLGSIELGSDGPGRSFQLFQRYLKQLKERGLLLAVVSRNEETDVRNVFENHSEMILRTDDIAAWRVNWKHKSENLKELADELNLGLDSFVFLDDDMAVRMEVSMRLPVVHVVPLPLDPVRYCETLERLWLFDEAHVTEVDVKRTRMMQEESRRQQERKAAANLDDYLAGLELKLDIREASESEWPRIAQLTQRTNQFNLSLRRRSVEQVSSLAEDWSVLIVKACDRFGDYGIVGVSVIRNVGLGVCEIDTLLMSCRALGRGVEDGFLYGIAKAASAQGALLLRAPFVEGPRNQLLKDFLVRTGFRESHPNTWELEIKKVPPSPKHIGWINQERELVILPTQ